MRFRDYHQLTHVAAGVHVGLVSFDPDNANHLKLFRSKGGALYQRLAQRHGAEFNLENIENIIKAAAQSDAILRFVVVAKRLCKPVIAGIMTSVQTYDVKWDQGGNRYVVPLEHGEDLVLNERIAKWFRKATKTEANPPDEKTLNLVLLSMLKAGRDEIESPNRLWMIPTGHEDSRDFYKAFGGVSPTFHLHTHKNQWLVEALKKIGKPRYYGDALMISGQIDYSDATAKSDKEPFNPTIVQCTSEEAVNAPIFDFVSTPTEIANKAYCSPSKPAGNDDHKSGLSTLRVA